MVGLGQKPVLLLTPQLHNHIFTVCQKPKIPKSTLEFLYSFNITVFVNLHKIIFLTTKMYISLFNPFTSANKLTHL